MRHPDNIWIKEMGGDELTNENAIVSCKAVRMPILPGSREKESLTYDASEAPV